MGKITCPYCKRDNFKTQRGLNQHVNASTYCRDQRQAQIGVVGAKRASDYPLPSAKSTKLQCMLVDDALAWQKLSANGDKMRQMQDDHRNATGDDIEMHNDSFVFDDDDFYDALDAHAANDNDNYFGTGGNGSGAASRETIDSFKEYVAFAQKKHGDLSKQDQGSIKLLSILRQAKAPMCLYETILDWHLRQIGRLQDHETLKHAREYSSRKVLMNKLKKRYHMEDKFAKTTPIVLPHSRAKVNLVTHDARAMVESLLTDPRFKPEDFLFFNDDPFAPPPDDLDYLGDINTGLSYTETYKKLITNPKKQILVPIPLYIDGAVTGQYDKLQVEALKMTLGIFNRKARDKDYAWRTLGYVANYTKEGSKGERMFLDSGHLAAKSNGSAMIEGEGDDDEAEEGVHSAQDYHTILATILESFVQMQEDGMQWDLEWKGKVYEDTELIFFVPFVKCDGDEGDKLTGSYRSRGKNVSQLCHYCTCPTQDTDNPKANYPYKTVPMIKKLVARKDLEGLKELSQQYLDNAFYPVRFGLHNNRGIHGACPIEMLHALLLGLFQYSRDIFFVHIGKTGQSAESINALAKLYGRLFAHQSDRNKPKTNFANGIQKGKLTAKEYTGVLLLMAAVMRSSEGREILTSSRNGNFKHDWMLKDWVLLIETLLQWEAFLKQDEMQKNHVHRLQKKNRYVLYLMKNVARRTEGMGLKIMKFHAITHLAEDIQMFGVPTNTDTGSNECHHKGTKVAAKLTQRDVTTFEEQTSNRLDEFQVIDLALEEMDGHPLWEYFDGYDHGVVLVISSEVDKHESDGDENSRSKVDENLADVPETWTGGTRIQVYRKENGMAWFKYPHDRTKKSTKWDKTCVRYMTMLQEELMEKGVLHTPLSICTEHKRDSQIFRGSPDYRRKGCWNDWVKVDWGPGYGILPCELWCFIDLSHLPNDFQMEYDGSIVQKGIYAVVESSAYSTDEEEIGMSDLFMPLTKEFDLTEDGQPRGRVFYLADVDAIVSTTIIVPDVGCENRMDYFEVMPMHKWAENFVHWVEAPHKDDVIEDDPVEVKVEDDEEEEDEEASDEDGECSDEEADESDDEDEESDGD